MIPHQVKSSHDGAAYLKIITRYHVEAVINPVNRHDVLTETDHV